MDQPSLFDLIASRSDLRAFVASVKIAGLRDLLERDGPLTIFAPADQAFRKLPSPLVDVLLASPERLEKMISFHILPERLSSAVLRTIEPRQRVLGKRFSIYRRDLRVNGVRVIEPDLECRNGLVHVIDGVLLPERDRYERLVHQIIFQRRKLIGHRSADSDRKKMVTQQERYTRLVIPVKTGIQ